MLQIALVGSGGVGTIASVGLERSGKASVTSVIRRDFEHVKNHGYTIDSINYGHLEGWRPSRIAASVNEAATLCDCYDYVLVCTKVLPELYRTEELIRPLVVEGHTQVVLCQNGIGIEQPVAEAFPTNIVLSMISMIGSTNMNGVIDQPEHDNSVVGFHRSKGLDSAVLEKAAKDFAELYSTAGAHCTFAPDLLYSRWRKLVYNSAINTVCALTQLDTGRAYLSGLDQALIVPAMHEIIAIGNVVLAEEGLPLLTEDLVETMLRADDGIYYRPSMLIDIDKGNPLELEVILGNPLRTAQKLGIAAPTLTMIYSALRGVQFRLLKVPCPEQGPKRDEMGRLW